MWGEGWAHHSPTAGIKLKLLSLEVASTTFLGISSCVLEHMDAKKVSLARQNTRDLAPTSPPCPVASQVYKEHGTPPVAVLGQLCQVLRVCSGQFQRIHDVKVILWRERILGSVLGPLGASCFPTQLYWIIPASA